MRRTFGGRSPVVALDDVSFAVPAGQCVGVLGVNGAGKTTLIKVLATLLLPTAGQAWVAGCEVVRDAVEVRRRISVVFGGERGLYLRLSALDNLRFFGLLQGLPRRAVEERAREALDEVGLSPRARDPVETFSRGMRQRVHIAAALLARPVVLLLDEPTIGLDAIEANRLRRTVAAMVREGTTVVLTSHYLADVEQLCDRVLFVHGGHLLHDLPAAEFRRRAGYAGELRVRGTGEPGDGLLALQAEGHDVDVTAGGGSWTAAVRVRDWRGPTLSLLAAAVARSAGVEDVEVVPVPLEAVMAKLVGE